MVVLAQTSTDEATRSMTTDPAPRYATHFLCVLMALLALRSPSDLIAQSEIRFDSWLAPQTQPADIQFEISDQEGGLTDKEQDAHAEVRDSAAEEPDKDNDERSTGEGDEEESGKDEWPDEEESGKKEASEGDEPEGEADRWDDERPLELEAEFQDGFGLVSKDEEFELKFHILNQVDFKSFWPVDQSPAAQNGIYIPRMRVYFEGKLSDPFRYEISLQRSVEGAFDLLDANLDIRFSEALQLRLGRTLIPYSYTWYDHLEQYFIVPERPLFPLNFGLSRAAGVQLWGQDELRRWQYSLGAYNGRVAGLADDSPAFDAVGYLNFRPFAVTHAGSALENLNFGGSLVLGETRRPSETLPGRTSIQASENDEAANAASAVFLEFNPHIVSLGERVVGALHTAWYHGPFSVEAECNALKSEFFNEEEEEFVRLPATGFHVTLASFLTGETVRGREAVQPLRPFDPRCGRGGMGAVEVYGRFSQLGLGNALFERELANPEEWTDNVSMTDIGLNWYLNRYAKFCLDWQHSEFGSPVLVNAAKNKFSSDNDLLWFRCQVYF